MADRRLTSDDVAGGAQLAWLLDLTWAGRVYRFSSEPLEVSSDDGDLLYDGGILNDLEVELGYSIFDQEPEFPSVAVDLDFGQLSVARKILEGHPLRGAAVELSLYVIGTTYEDRWRIVRGRLVAPEIGAVGEPVSASIEEVKQLDPLPALAPSAVVDSDTYPDSRDSAVGEAYPVVFGDPGATGLKVDTGGSFVDVEVVGSPALPVDIPAAAFDVRYLLISDGEVAASTVTLRVPPGTWVDPATGLETALTYVVPNIPVTVETDGRGRTVSTVDLTSANLNVNGSLPDTEEQRAWRFSEEFWVTWDDGSGVLSAASGSAISTAGDLLEHAALLSGATFDEEQIRAASQRLTLPVSGFLNDPEVTWLDWIKDNLIPLIPYSLVWTPSGLQLLSWGLYASANEAIAHVEAGDVSGVYRVGGFVEVEHPAYRSASLKYARKADTGKYGRRTTYEANAVSPSHGSAHADHAESSRVDAEDWSGDTDIIYRQEGAHYVLRNAIKLGASTLLETTYEAGTEWIWLPLGSVVTLSDDELAFDTLPSVLSRLVLRLSGPALTFTTILDPVATLPLLPS